MPPPTVPRGAGRLSVPVSLGGCPLGPGVCCPLDLVVAVTICRAGGRCTGRAGCGAPAAGAVAVPLAVPSQTGGGCRLPALVRAVVTAIWRADAVGASPSGPVFGGCHMPAAWGGGAGRAVAVPAGAVAVAGIGWPCGWLSGCAGRRAGAQAGAGPGHPCGAAVLWRGHIGLLLSLGSLLVRTPTWSERLHFGPNLPLNTLMPAPLCGAGISLSLNQPLLDPTSDATHGVRQFSAVPEPRPPASTCGRTSTPTSATGGCTRASARTGCPRGTRYPGRRTPHPASAPGTRG